MRLIDADALKKAIEQGEGFSWDSYGKDDLCVRKKYIDNAPTVPLPDFKEGYKQAIIDGKTNFQRPTVDNLNMAINTIKDVCEANISCFDCPMIPNCNEFPPRWEEVKNNDN